MHNAKVSRLTMEYSIACKLNSNCHHLKGILTMKSENLKTMKSEVRKLIQTTDFTGLDFGGSQ